MAYRRRRKYTRRPRKTYKRRYVPMRYRRRKTRLPKDNIVIPRNPFVAPFKQRHRTTLRYNEDIQIAVPAANNTIRAYTYKTSSIYDPNSTGIGHQPFGRDQISPYYVTYQVLASRISVTAMSNNQDDPIVWGITTIDTSSSLTGNPVYTMCEFPNTVSTVAVGNKAAGFCPVKCLTSRFSPTKWFSLSKTGFVGDPSYGALMNTDPAITAFWQIWFGSYIGTIPTGEFQARVTIEYDVLFSNPVPPAASS